MSIEKAAEAMYEIDAEPGFDGIPNLWAEREAIRRRYSKMARAALPYLMEEPTEKEISEVYDAAHRCPTPVGMSMSQLTYALRKFVSVRRNAPPEPPPNVPEPIREMIALRPHALLPDNVIDAYNENIVEAFHRGQKSVTPAVPPEPDPRREAIIRVILSYLNTREKTEGETADEILALD